MTIQKATMDDLTDIVRLESECFLDEAWSSNMIEYDLSERSVYFIARTEEGHPMGYISMLPLTDEGEILRVCVRKAFRRKGVGKALMKAIIDECVVRCFEKIYLEVSSSNTVAIKLYENLGFNKISTRKQYYADGSDALIYVLLLL